MVKIAGRQQSRRTASSTGYQTQASAYEREKKKKDNRIVTPGQGKQGSFICPECQAIVTAKKASQNECGEWGRVSGIKSGDLIFSNHRVGGRRYSIKRGDVLCMGVGLPIPKE